MQGVRDILNPALFTLDGRKFENDYAAMLLPGHVGIRCLGLRSGGTQHRSSYFHVPASRPLLMQSFCGQAVGVEVGSRRGLRIRIVGSTWMFFDSVSLLPIP